MAEITTVLFDLDGTLIDSVRLILDSYHHTLATHGLEPMSDAHWLAGLGTPLRVQCRNWSDDPVRLEAMIETYREYNLTHHDAMVTAYPGAVEMVRAIRGAGDRTRPAGGGEEWARHPRRGLPHRPRHQQEPAGRTPRAPPRGPRGRHGADHRPGRGHPSQAPSRADPQGAGRPR